jgi:hypothetical protein
MFAWTATPCPNGAKGIEGDDFDVEFRGDKIVAGDTTPSTPGMRSGVLDLHETHPEADGPEQHRTVFAMRRDDLATLFGEVAPTIPELFSLPRRCGWAS